MLQGLLQRLGVRLDLESAVSKGQLMGVFAPPGPLQEPFLGSPLGSLAAGETGTRHD